MDPPYQGVCSAETDRYATKVCHDEFAESFNDLNKKGCMFIVSYEAVGRATEFRQAIAKKTPLSSSRNLPPVARARRRC